jgi:hypothetical protein
MDLFIPHAAQLAERVQHAHSRRAYFVALSDFERMLTVTLDYPAGSFTFDDLEALRALADAVVEHIEARVESRGDGATVERQLVDGIYRIRSEVEAMYGCVARDAAAGHPSRNADAPTAVTPAR